MPQRKLQAAQIAAAEAEANRDNALVGVVQAILHDAEAERAADMEQLRTERTADMAQLNARIDAIEDIVARTHELMVHWKQAQEQARRTQPDDGTDTGTTA